MGTVLSPRKLPFIWIFRSRGLTPCANFFQGGDCPQVEILVAIVSVLV